MPDFNTFVDKNFINKYSFIKKLFNTLFLLKKKNFNIKKNINKTKKKLAISINESTALTLFK